MDFLKRNSGKIALLAIIAFFTLPFIYGNEEEEDFSPFAVKSGMSYQANPISKLANKIASFYGFSKPASGMVASSKGVDSIKEKVSENNFFTKENISSSATASKTGRSKEDVAVASSKNYKKYDLNSSDFDTSKARVYNSGNNLGYADSYGGSSTGYYGNNSNSPVKGYVTVNGQNYEVIEDIKGNRYVVTPKGHIPYEEVMRRTVSEQEFAAAKKRLSNASDMEILAALQEEKAKNNSDIKTNKSNYQTGATSYRNGTLSSMGGMNYAQASTNDKGFDDNALSDAYADLKSVDLKIDASSTSQRGKGGSHLRDSFRVNTDNDQKNAEAKEQSSPTAVVAQQIKSRAQQSLNVAKGDNYDYAPQEEVRNPASFKTVNLTKDKTYEETGNDTGMVFISIEEENSPYEVWGQAGKYPFKDGNERNGIITSIYLDNNGDLGYGGNENEISYHVKDINQSIENIKNIMYELDENDKVYIDTSTMDDFSKALLIEKSGLSDFITDNPEKASIKLSGPICTPDSFKQFVEELEQKQIKLLAERKSNPAI